MAVADQFSYLEQAHFSPRARGKQKQCMGAGCQLVLRSKSGYYYCVSQRLPPRAHVHYTASVSEWVRTPDHPDGFKWRKVRRELPLRRKLLNVLLCPEGLWRD